MVFLTSSNFISANRVYSCGSTGPTGPSGINGLNGPTGPQGAPGTNGTNGAPGSTGPPGPIGPAGATGLAGTPGTNGAAGAKGDPGQQGPAGGTGPAGRGLVLTTIVGSTNANQTAPASPFQYSLSGKPSGIYMAFMREVTYGNSLSAIIYYNGSNYSVGSAVLNLTTPAENYAIFGANGDIYFDIGKTGNLIYQIYSYQ
jgi:hypothetical protein